MVKGDILNVPLSGTFVTLFLEVWRNLSPRYWVARKLVGVVFANRLMRRFGAGAPVFLGFSRV